MKYKGNLRRLFAAVLIAAAFSWLSVVPASAQTKLEVAYIPIMPMSQLFVLEQEGWAKEAGLDLKLTKFSSGPAIVQAIAAGRFDVIYIGIGQAMVTRANGVPIKVVASNGIEQITLIAQGELSKYFSEAASPADAIRKFTADKGRKPKIASLPKGSVPETVFRHWLVKVAGLTEKDVDILGMGAGKVQQAMLARSVDGASILEPIITIIQQRLPDAKIIARALAVDPDLLLMDEPFGALDAITRQSLQDELLRIWHETGKSVLFVTHDIDEAVYLGDRVLLLGGTPATITQSYDIAAGRPRRRDQAQVTEAVSRVKRGLSQSFEGGAGI